MFPNIWDPSRIEGDQPGALQFPASPRSAFASKLIPIETSAVWGMPPGQCSVWKQMKGRTESGRCKSLVGVASWSGFSRRTERCTQRQVISGAMAFQLRFSLRRNGKLWENMEYCSASGTQASWSKKHQKPSLAKIMQTKCTGIQCTAYAIWWALSWVTIWCSGDAAAKCCLESKESH